MTGRKGAEAAAFERAFYPGAKVLVNRLGIRDAATLDAAERMFTDERVRGPMPATTQEPSYAGFKAIHFHLFQDLYAWAGQERDYTTGRGATPFAPPEQIKPWSSSSGPSARPASSGD